MRINAIVLRGWEIAAVAEARPSVFEREAASMPMCFLPLTTTVALTLCDNLAESGEASADLARRIRLLLAQVDV